MANITRKHHKIFASSATNNGQFGSAQLGTKINSNDPDVIQALSAYDQGWNSATTGGTELPTLEEMQGLQYNNSYQIAYLLQKGIPEWNTSTDYYIGDIAREIAGTKFYKSITDNNIGNALTDINNWEFLGNFGLATTTTQGISYLDKPITIANNATDADHDIDFGAGNFDFDDGSGQAVATALTKQIDAAWAEGDNVGGLDTGTVAADTIYYCFAIWNPTTSTSDFLFSASLLNPILPSGYTKKKRIGALAANGGANIYQGVWSDKNRQFKFDVNISTINTNSPPTSRTNVLAPAPPNSLLKFDATYTANINNVAPFYILVTNPNQTDTAPDAENNTLVYVDNFAGYVANTVIDEVRVDDNRNIAYRASNGIANNFRLNSRGWFENNLF